METIIYNLFANFKTISFFDDGTLLCLACSIITSTIIMSRFSGSYNIYNLSKFTEIHRLEVSGVFFTRRSLIGIIQKKDVFEFHNRKAIFQIFPSTFANKILKKMEGEKNFQTGESSFDSKIILVSDISFFTQQLKESHETRNIIMSLIELKCKKLWGDGRNIYAHFDEYISDEKPILELLAKFHQQLQSIQVNEAPKLPDAFLARADLVEKILKLIAIYGLVGIQFIFWFSNILSDNHDYYYLDATGFIFHGLIFAGLFIIMIPTLIYLALRKSARLKQVMLENLFMMILTIPCAGFSFAHHFNKLIDSKPNVIIVAKVVNFNYIKFRKNSKYGSSDGSVYHIFIENDKTAANFNIPRKITVSHEVYTSLKKNDLIEMTIAQGGLNHPWLKEIRFKHL